VECQDIDEAELFHRRTELHQAETTASKVERPELERQQNHAEVESGKGS